MAKRSAGSAARINGLTRNVALRCQIVGYSSNSSRLRQPVGKVGGLVRNIFCADHQSIMNWQRKRLLTFGFLLDDDRRWTKKCLLNRWECCWSPRQDEPKSTHFNIGKRVCRRRVKIPTASKYVLKDKSIKDRIARIFRDGAQRADQALLRTFVTGCRN